MQDYNDAGIEIYVKTALDEISVNLGLRMEFTDSLYTELITRAEGVFLFVHFAVEHIIEKIVQGCTEREILSELHLLLQELSKTYEGIFTRIAVACRPEVALILSLLDDARHNVSLDELYGAWLMANQSMGNTTLTASDVNIKQFRL